MERGQKAVAAAITAIRLRFRPIVMTSLAFILGLIPLVLASGPGSASRRGIGTGVFFGMIIAVAAGIVSCRSSSCGSTGLNNASNVIRNNEILHHHHSHGRLWPRRPAGSVLPCGKLTRPDLELPEAIAPGATDSATIADVAWWTFYGDSTLCRMIERALAHNRTFASAIARVEAARQQFKGVRADQWPKISATVGASRETNDYYNERFINDPEYDLKASLQWELDLWGKRRNAAKAANADYRATLDDMRAVQMELVADVATAYYHLMALDSELAIVRRTLVNRQEAVDKAKLRFEGGLTSELVYQQAIVEFAATADLVPLLESRIAACENALSTLMGNSRSGRAI